MPTLDQVRRRGEIQISPDKFRLEHEKILESHDFKCPFKVGDLVKRKSPLSPFTFPLNEMPAKVVKVYNDFETVTSAREFTDMACAVVLDDNSVTVYLFDSKDFVPYTKIDAAVSELAAGI